MKSKFILLVSIVSACTLQAIHEGPLEDWERSAHTLGRRSPHDELRPLPPEMTTVLCQMKKSASDLRRSTSRERLANTKKKPDRN